MQTMLTTVVTFTLSAVLNHPLVSNPALWSMELLTPAGKAFVRSTSFSTFLGLNSSVGAPFYLPSRQLACRTVAKPTTWAFGNLARFVGRDYAAMPFWASGVFFYQIFLTYLVAAMATIVGFVGIHVFWTVLGKRTVYHGLPAEQQLIVTMHSTLAALTVAQLVPYTYYILPLLFGPDVLVGCRPTTRACSRL